MFLIHTIVLIVFGLTGTFEDRIAVSYIEEFRDLAIIEMHRSGIPASITLAQGMHESAYGKSPLAMYANNHFGIKCKSYWRGDTYYHKDDDTDQQGQLIDSCFRSYESAIASYVDHSNFLMKSSHYQWLFSFDHTDYESWAHGLKKSGYATDPAYAEKLLVKIHKYGLDQYDHWDLTGLR